jgi:hypothetical protein
MIFPPQNGGCPHLHQERWILDYNCIVGGQDEAYSIAAGANGDIYAAGRSNGDAVVFCLSPGGTTRWIYRHWSPSNRGAWAKSIVTAADGNVYVAGMSEGDWSDDDLLVFSLTPNGSKRWAYTCDGPGGDNDEALSIVAGSDGNLYAAGYSNGFHTLEDFIVVSLTP